MAPTSRRVYLDVSALCRPFDDQSQMRIRLETDAVQLILSYVQLHRLELVVSVVHDAEIAAIEDPSEREHLEILLGEQGMRSVQSRADVRRRAEVLVHRGLGAADAAHFAFAEAAHSDFVSCDDRLLRQCRRLKPAIWVGTPIAYCEKENLR